MDAQKISSVKRYLLQFLEYNDWANLKTMEAVLTLPDRNEAIDLISHMIHAQDKWYNRITPALPDDSFQWESQSFTADTLEAEWKRSIAQWQTWLSAANDADLDKEVVFTAKAIGKTMAVAIKDIIIQINCHSVHHRAQINKMISAQGVKVPATDYIMTTLRALE